MPVAFENYWHFAFILLESKGTMILKPYGTLFVDENGYIWDKDGEPLKEADGTHITAEAIEKEADYWASDEGQKVISDALDKTTVA